LSTAIVEQLKAQLKQLEAERREHEKAAAKIRAQEVKVRKALASVASLVPPSSN
jgi:energy-converting hydrogenase Eha subunit H